jgi:hypothetical protein
LGCYNVCRLFPLRILLYPEERSIEVGRLI